MSKEHIEFWSEMSDKILGRKNNMAELKNWQKDIMNGDPFVMRLGKDEDPVNHPSHYTDGKIEVIDFIEDKKFDFCLGNAVKYIARAGKKDKSKEIEDLEKAVWYIQRRIKQLKKAQEKIPMYHGYPVVDSDTGFTIKEQTLESFGIDPAVFDNKKEDDKND